jgi:DNA-binding transcriptional regulator YiaG
MSEINPTWKGNEANTLEIFDATEMLNAPFRVLLSNSARAILDGEGNVQEVFIPDPEGLVKAVAQSRVLHPHKLNGADLRFLRSALQLKSKELAKRIAVTAEHMSRWERGEKPLSPQSEMLIRIFTYVSTLPFTTCKRAAAEKIADQVGKVFGSLNITPVHDIDDEISFVFERVPIDCEGGDHSHTLDGDNGLWDEPSPRKAA